MRGFVFLIILMFVNQAATCGQKGPLVLPDKGAVRIVAHNQTAN
jgi:predicted small lipoprotein YifL